MDNPIAAFKRWREKRRQAVLAAKKAVADYHAAKREEEIERARRIALNFDRHGFLQFESTRTNVEEFERQIAIKETGAQPIINTTVVSCGVMYRFKLNSTPPYENSFSRY